MGRLVSGQWVGEQAASGRWVGKPVVVGSGIGAFNKTP